MKWFHKHNWRVVAYDQGMSTTFGKQIKHKHSVSYRRCDCGKREVVIDEHDSFKRSMAVNHPTINKARHMWLERDELMLTDEGAVFYDDYVCVPSPSGRAIHTWKRQPITGIDKIIKTLKEDPDYVALSKHSMVTDALDQFEIAVKLHTNL